MNQAFYINVYDVSSPAVYIIHNKKDTFKANMSQDEYLAKIVISDDGAVESIHLGSARNYHPRPYKAKEVQEIINSSSFIVHKGVRNNFMANDPFGRVDPVTYMSIILGNPSHYVNAINQDNSPNNNCIVRFPLYSTNDSANDASLKAMNIINQYAAAHPGRKLIIPYAFKDHIVTLIGNPQIQNPPFQNLPLQILCFDSSGAFINNLARMPFGVINNAVTPIQFRCPQGKRRGDCSYWTEAAIQVLSTERNPQNPTTTIIGRTASNIATIHRSLIKAAAGNYHKVCIDVTRYQESGF